MVQEVPIIVAARVRPLVGQERLHHEESCISFVNGKPHLILGKNRGFKFDHVFQPAASQDDVYNSCVYELIKNCMDGYNATVFAYGQTGSGKTYTMGTGNSGGLVEDEIGIIPRAIKDIFHIIEEKSGEVLYRLKVSFIEIYMEEAKDLLEFEGSSKELHIREDDKGNTIVTGLREEVVYCMDDVMSCLDSGASLRHTASTQMNEYSSRSHCIFTLTIERHPLMKEDINDGDSDSVTTAKFHFVDLAGSERAHRTGNQGERFRESITINGGLLALGNVISALSDSKRRQQHVPYRQSKLTRLLKDSLGGNSRTLMIACLSSCSSDFDENLNSLKYAARVRNIKNKPVINTVAESARLAKMQNEIQVLRDELQRQKTVPFSAQDVKKPIDGTKVKTLEEEIKRLKNSCHVFETMSHEAASLIKLFYGSDMPPYDIQDKLAEWITRWDSFEGIRHGMGHVFDDGKIQNDVIRRLNSQLQMCKNDLQSDQEIFAEKAKEIEEYKMKLNAVESEKEDLMVKLEEFLEIERQKERQMFEQQLKIRAYEDEIDLLRGKNDEKAIRANPRKVPPRSAPSRLRKKEESILSRFQKKYASFEDDHLMQSFRAHNALLVSKYEDIDEVSHDEFNSSDDDENEVEHAMDNEKPGLKSTFTKEIPLMSTFTKRVPWSRTSVRSQVEAAKEKLSRNPERKTKSARNVSTTPSKLPVRYTPSSSNPIDTTEKRAYTTENTKRKLRNVELDLKDAKQKVVNLQGNIKQKEELIKELLQSDKEKQELNSKFKEKVKSMEKEIDQSQKELEETKIKLDSYEKQGLDKQKIEKEYKRKLKILEGKISTLEKKKNEADVMDDFRNKGDRKIRDLEGHIERLRNQHEEMVRKLKSESEKKSRLEQDLSKGELKIKELESKTDQQSKLLKRKTEEVATVQRKLRSGSNAAEKDERNELEEKRKKIDEEIEKIVQQKQNMEEIEQELKKREEIVMKKESLLKEKYELEIKKLRSSQILSQDVMRLSVQLDDVQKALVDAKRASIIAKDKTKFQDDVSKLLRRKTELDQQRKDLESKLEDNDVLEPTEERRLIELMEAVEALDMAIEYKTEIIEGKKHELGDVTENENIAGKLLENLREMNQEEMKGLLQKYFERVIELKETERKMIEVREEIEIDLVEKEKIVQELQHCLNQTEARAERRLTELEKEHEKQIQFLVEKINENAKSEPSNDAIRSLERKVQELEKELFYYKKTSRELKHRLREVSGSSASIMAESISSEKYTNKTHSEKPKENQAAARNEELKQSAKTAASENIIGRSISEENFHLPPVQREEKKQRNEHREGVRSPKSQSTKNFERYVNQDEQKRLKEIFEARQQTSKLKKDQKYSRGDGPFEQRSSSSSNLQSYTKDSVETGKNPWS